MEPREKNPAAVALGKRSVAVRTPEQMQAFVAASKAAAAKRTAAERSAISRKAAMTRRLAGPTWARKQNSGSAAVPSNVVETEFRPPDAGPELPPDLAHLDGAIDKLSDEMLEKLLAALAGRPA